MVLLDLYSANLDCRTHLLFDSGCGRIYRLAQLDFPCGSRRLARYCVGQQLGVGNQDFSSLDLFFDEKARAYCYKGRMLALDDKWRPVEDIFAFDINAFAEFHSVADEDD